MKQKMAAVILAAILSCSMLGGCGSGGSPSQSASGGTAQTSSSETVEQASASETVE